LKVILFLFGCGRVWWWKGGRICTTVFDEYETVFFFLSKLLATLDGVKNLLDVIDIGEHGCVFENAGNCKCYKELPTDLRIRYGYSVILHSRTDAKLCNKI
jgi:hypothetical protein